jgi:hypothetical protein
MLGSTFLPPNAKKLTLVQLKVKNDVSANVPKVNNSPSVMFRDVKEKSKRKNVV